MFGFIDTLFAKTTSIEPYESLYVLKLVGYQIGTANTLENIIKFREHLQKNLGNIITDIYSQVC